METKDAITGKTVIAVAAHYFNEEDQEHVFIPVAKMFDGNPFDELIPPHDPRFDSMPDHTACKIEQDPIEAELDELFKDSPSASHFAYPYVDWQAEVKAGDTVLGYRDWLYSRIEQAGWEQDHRPCSLVERPALKVFSRRFEGVCPVGAVAQVAAGNAQQAAELLTAALEARGLKQSEPITADSMTLFAPEEPTVEILLDGDY